MDVASVSVGVLHLRNDDDCCGVHIPSARDQLLENYQALRRGHLQHHLHEFAAAAFSAAGGLVAQRGRGGQVQEYVDQLSAAVCQGHRQADHLPSADRVLVDRVRAELVPERHHHGHPILFPAGLFVLAHIRLLSHSGHAEWLLLPVVLELHCIWSGEQ